MAIRTGIASTLMAAALVSLAACDTSPVAGPTRPAVQPYAPAARYIIDADRGWDYVTVDPAARRLYVAHATRVAVLDADNGGIVGQIPDTPGVHGVALAAPFGKGFVTCGREGAVRVFDLKTLKPIATVKAGANPDAIVYDPFSKRVLVCNGKSGDITVIDPGATDAATVTIPVGGKLEFAVADGKGHVYVNVEDRNELVAIDTRTMKLDGRWSVAPCQSPTGLAMDVAARRLFVVGGNKTMVILNADNGTQVATVAIGAGVDGVAFDPTHATIVSANGQDGTVTVVHERDPQTFALVQTLPTVKGARTIAVDPQSGRLYLPCQFDAPDVGTRFGIVVLQPSAPATSPR